MCGVNLLKKARFFRLTALKEKKKVMPRILLWMFEMTINFVSNLAAFLPNWSQVVLLHLFLAKNLNHVVWKRGVLC